MVVLSPSPAKSKFYRKMKNMANVALVSPASVSVKK